MRLERQTSQLLIIDIQEKLAPAVLNHQAVIASARRLIEAARRLNVPVTVSEQYPRGLGATVAPLREQLGENSAVLEKLHFSCARDAALKTRLEVLKAEGRYQVVVAGMEAHVCVAQTVLDLTGQDFQCFVVGDATSSRHEESKTLAIQRLRHAGAATVNSEMVLFEWLDQAGTQEFKDIQPLIR